MIVEAVKRHLFETKDEMKANVAKELSILEENIKFEEYEDRTDIVIMKDGKQVSVCVEDKRYKC